jgi:AraC-like DNA-binding protein
MALAVISSYFTVFYAIMGFFRTASRTFSNFYSHQGLFFKWFIAFSKRPTMITVIPRYFQKNNQLTTLSSDGAFGVEFRMQMDIPRYTMIVTTHVLVFVLKGTKTIHLPDNDIIINPGEFVFIPKGFYLFSDVQSNTNGFERVVLFFEDQFLHDLITTIAHIPHQKSISSTTIVTQPISPLLMQSITSLRMFLSCSSNYGEPLMRLKMQEVLLSILESDNNSTFLAALRHIDFSPHTDLRDFMQAHVTEPLTVTEFAHLSCRSLSQFTRDFRALFHETPQQWIRARRLEEAHLLLHTTNQTLSQVCDRCGFQSYSHFIQLFRKQYGITPKRLMLEIR